MREIHGRDRYRCTSWPIERRIRISFERVYFRDDEHERSVIREYASEIKRRTQTNWNALGCARVRSRTFVDTLATINHQSAYIGLRTTNLL